ncbi:hypothetical protein SESBI_19703 [Sesbania bispinosa]|nr:hypothetical protein SESBI_19703 [Sesbania bispinosa]
MSPSRLPPRPTLRNRASAVCDFGPTCDSALHPSCVSEPRRFSPATLPWSLRELCDRGAVSSYSSSSGDKGSASSQGR